MLAALVPLVLPVLPGLRWPWAAYRTYCMYVAGGASDPPANLHGAIHVGGSSTLLAARRSAPPPGLRTREGREASSERA